MNTGILEDGSLSSRLKGDLYWKKQKLILRAEESTQREEKARKHFYSKFDDRNSVEGLKQDSIPFTERRISPAMISGYAEFIPDNYIAQIKNASLKVTVYDKDGRFAGLSITGVHSGWYEIVWIALPQEKPEHISSVELVTYIVNSAGASGLYKGVFAELHMTPEEQHMEKVFSSVGMSVVEKKNNLYEFCAKDITGQKTLLDAADRIPCVPLFFLTEKEKNEIESIMYNETGSIPIQFPIPWDSYRQDLSLVHFDASNKNVGILFVSQVGDTMVIELLYGKNPMITAALLGTAIRTSVTELAPSQKILVPIVLSATRPIVEKLAPNATREPLYEAVFAFDENI